MDGQTSHRYGRLHSMKRGKNGGQSGPELGGTGPKKLSETVMWCLLLLILALRCSAVYYAEKSKPAVFASYCMHNRASCSSCIGTVIEI